MPVCYQRDMAHRLLFSLCENYKNGHFRNFGFLISLILLSSVLRFASIRSAARHWCLPPKQRQRRKLYYKIIRKKTNGRISCFPILISHISGSRLMVSFRSTITMSRFTVNSLVTTGLSFLTMTHLTAIFYTGIPGDTLITDKKEITDRSQMP